MISRLQTLVKRKTLEGVFTNMETPTQPINENLAKVHRSLKKLNPQFKVDLETFATEMENEENLQGVYNYLGRKNPEFTIDFESFQSDMGVKKKPLPTEVSELGPVDQNMVSGQDAGDGSQDPLLEEKPEVKNEGTPVIATEDPKGESRFSSFLGRVNQAFYGLPADIAEGVAIGGSAIERGTGINPDAKASDNFLYKWAQSYRGKIKEIAPNNPEFQNELQESVGQAVGQLGGLVLTGGLSRAPSMLAPMVQGGKPVLQAAKEVLKGMASPTGLTGAMQMGNAEFKQALESGESEEVAFEQFLKNAGVGSVLERIPVQLFFKRLNDAAGGGVVNMLKKGTSGGFEEMITEVTQQLYANQSANQTYEKTTRDLLDGVGESGGIGFGLGFMLNAMGVSLRKAKKNATPEQAKDIEKAQSAIEEAQNNLEDQVDENFSEQKINTDQANEELRNPIPGDSGESTPTQERTGDNQPAATSTPETTDLGRESGQEPGEDSRGAATGTSKVKPKSKENVKSKKTQQTGKAKETGGKEEPTSATGTEKVSGDPSKGRGTKEKTGESGVEGRSDKNKDINSGRNRSEDGKTGVEEGRDSGAVSQEAKVEQREKRQGRDTGRRGKTDPQPGSEAEAVSRATSGDGGHDTKRKEGGGLSLESDNTGSLRGEGEGVDIGGRSGSMETGGADTKDVKTGSGRVGKGTSKTSHTVDNGGKDKVSVVTGNGNVLDQSKTSNWKDFQKEVTRLYGLAEGKEATEKEAMQDFVLRGGYAGKDLETFKDDAVKKAKEIYEDRIQKPQPQKEDPKPQAPAQKTAEDAHTQRRKEIEEERELEGRIFKKDGTLNKKAKKEDVARYKELREKNFITLNAKTVPELSNHENQSVRRTVAEYEKTPEDILIKLAQDDWMDVAMAAIRNPNATDEVLKAAQKSSDSLVRDEAQIILNKGEDNQKQQINNHLDLVKDFNALTKTRKSMKAGQQLSQKIKKWARNNGYEVKTAASGKLTIIDKTTGNEARKKRVAEDTSHFRTLEETKPEVRETYDKLDKAGLFEEIGSNAERIAVNLSPRDFKKAVRDLKGGKKSWQADELLSFIENIHDTKAIPFGSRMVTLDELSAIDEEVSKELPDNPEIDQRLQEVLNDDSFSSIDELIEKLENEEENAFFTEFPYDLNEEEKTELLTIAKQIRDENTKSEEVPDTRAEGESDQATGQDSQTEGKTEETTGRQKSKYSFLKDQEPKPSPRQGQTVTFTFLDGSVHTGKVVGLTDDGKHFVDVDGRGNYRVSDKMIMSDEDASALKTNLDDKLNKIAGRAEQSYDNTAGAGIGSGKVKSKPKNKTDLQEKIEFQNKEAEERFKKAENTSAKNVSSWKDKFKDITDFFRNFRRKYQNLNPRKFSEVSNKLRVFESAGEYTKVRAEQYIRGIFEPLTSEQKDIVVRRVVLEDLSNGISKGLEHEDSLPFGFSNKAGVEAEIARFKDLMKQEPAAQEAYDARQEFMESLYDELVANKLISDQGDYKTYYHRRTLEYLTDDIHQSIMHGRKLTKSQKDFMKARTGSKGKDYSTNFMESEFRVVADGLYELTKKKTMDAIMAPYEQQRLELRKAGKEAFKKELKDIKETYGKDSEVYELYEKQKNHFIDDYVRTNMPEGYIMWQPERGNIMFKQKMVSEAQIEAMMDDLSNIDTSGLGDALNVLEALQEQAKAMVMMGGKKKEYMVPAEVAATIDEIGSPPEKPNMIENMLRKTTQAWKVLVLLNPRRILKYNLNNMMGDFDGVISGDPTVMKYGSRAWKELYRYSKTGKITKELNEAFEQGVIDSGYDINEFKDIEDKQWMHYLKGNEPASLGRIFTKKSLKNLFNGDRKGFVKAYFDTARYYTSLRENWFRYAAYLRAKEKMESGDTFYWASTPSEIDGIADPKEKAGKLARELLGDYANISVNGQYIRKHLIPFYSWMEVNMSRYYNLLKNASNTEVQARVSSILLKKGLTRTATNMLWGYVQLGIFTAMIETWNKLMFPEEDEELSVSNTRGMHFILGRTDDGKILSLPIVGALYDAVEFFGLPDISNIIADSITSGQPITKGLTEAGKKFAISPGEKLAQGFNPFVKSAFELSTGQNLYPSIFKPRPIRDKGEYVARFFSLQEVYDHIIDKPRRHENLVTAIATRAITQELDPQMLSYYDVQNNIRDFKNIGGYISNSDEKDEKKQALYNWGLALRHENHDKAEQYLQQYYENGGTIKDLKQSIRRRDPLALLNARERKDVKAVLGGAKPRTEFGESLTPRDLKSIKLAMKYYQSTYKK